MSKTYKYTKKVTFDAPAREMLDIGNGTDITPHLLEEILLTNRDTQYINRLIGTLIAEENLWDIALELSESTHDRTAFRASWSLEWAYTIDPDEVVDRFQRVLAIFLKSKNGSVQRVFGKMIYDMMVSERVAISDETANSLTERSFSLLIAPEVAVAIKVWQIDLLSVLSNRIDWIEESLTEIVRAISESTDCTPALASRAKYYLKRVDKNNKRKKLLSVD